MNSTSADNSSPLLTGRTVLITGGASGLGAATARRFAARGARVMIVDLDGTRASTLAAELGDGARSLVADVTSAESINAAIERTISELGEIYGVVNCAGIAPAARVVGRDGPHDLDMFRRVIEVNLIGTFNVLRLAAARMVSNRPDAEGQRGVVVNTASIAAYEGQIGQAAYSASKGGVAAMTLPIARELAKHGIRVVTIAPGVIDTPLMSAMSDEVRDSLAAQIPFPARFGRPEEFAALAQHVFDNPLLNGTVIRLDGAARMTAR
jgi:NAD(P)-dependent dehydrogenase (short-subunit alcohol dehydrogenase family)